MFDRHPLEAQALADLDADRAAYDAHLETTLDLGPFGPYRDDAEFDRLHGLAPRPAPAATDLPF